MSSQQSNAGPQDTLRAPSAAPESRPSSSTKRQYSNKKESMNGPLYMQTVNRTVLVRRVKRKGDGPSKQLARWFVENQIGMSLFFSKFEIVSKMSFYTPLELKPALVSRRPCEYKTKIQTPCLVAPSPGQSSLVQHAVCLTALHRPPQFVSTKDFRTHCELHCEQLANAL